MDRTHNRFVLHPWHGLAVGEDPPRLVDVFVEVTPFDHAECKLDTATGLLRVKVPDPGSSAIPLAYGFVPRTLSGDRVRRLTPGAKRGDGDPLDIAVYCSAAVLHAGVVACARLVGGLQVLDEKEADDKLIAVLDGDPVFRDVQRLRDLPQALLRRYEHYLITHKLEPGGDPPTRLLGRYGKRRAHEVLRAAMADYDEEFGREAG
jgi:inorganic pyrophosphatase